MQNGTGESLASKELGTEDFTAPELYATVLPPLSHLPTRRPLLNDPPE
jgi:hypothetical protein